MSPGARLSSLTLSLAGAVTKGDLLVGWFGQYGANGQVRVSDNVNGPWTRSVAETFSNGTGDLALYYAKKGDGPQAEQYIRQARAIDPSDLQLLTDEIEMRVVKPTLASAGLFRSYPYLTRLYTTLSPEDMNRDPVFSENPDLPAVDPGK